MQKKPQSFLERATGILGINARNLLYVSRHNSQANKKFADDKLYTKNYLQSRGLSVAKTYNVIKNHKELRYFDPKALPESFVIKPNRGYGGEGILVVASKKGNKFLDTKGGQMSWKEMHRHMIAILDGKYAISGISDKAIIEERLIMHDDFKPLAEGGLPDLRVIVFNYVPVIAMLRLPTQDSDGKANLHLGAVGVGIDIATGKATYAVQRNKFVRKLPNGEKISDIRIPYWKDVLLTAAKAQHASQIGFLAVDLAMTTSGVKILELNARAGLSVQIANQVLLRARLKKVADLQVPNPEKGVEVSKTLFSSNIPTEETETEEEKPVIGLYEHLDILTSKFKNVLVKIEPHSDEVWLDEKYAGVKLKDNLLPIRLHDKRLALPVKFVNLSEEKYEGVIGGKFLVDFLIDLSKKDLPKIKPVAKKIEDVDEKIIRNIDKKLFEIESHINVIGAVRPTNLDQEKENFLANPKISPRFFYKKPSENISNFRRELKALPVKINHPLAKLYQDKIKEVLVKLDILEAIDSPKLQTLSERLYGKADKVLYDQAVRYLRDFEVQEDESKKMTHKAVVKKLEDFLRANKLTKWKVQTVEGRNVDIAVNKNGTIFLREGVTFSENRFKAIIIHEIATHIYRLENGLLQPYKIFEKGTAGYLSTEEGLAMYNQKKLGIPLGEKDTWMALRTIGAYLADEMSFVDLFHYLKDNYDLTAETAWQTCLKAKRGLIDTNKKIAFTRDVIYFSGYLKVKEYLDKTGESGLRNLYIGKLGLKDLPVLGNLEEYKVRYLPNYDI